MKGNLVFGLCEKLLNELKNLALLLILLRHETSKQGHQKLKLFG
jgi:hypothetical protein